MRKPSLIFWILLTVLIIFIGIYMVSRNKNNPAESVVSALSTKAKSSTSSPSFSVPGGWQQYQSSFGFSFWYPSTWALDDSEISQFSSLHAAFNGYSNLVTVGSSQSTDANGAIITARPSVTFNIASLSDEESQIGHTFQSSQEWAQESSTGLPTGVTVGAVTLSGESAIRLANFQVVVGKYQTIYWYDPSHNATVRLDYLYDATSDVATLDTIAQSFSFSKAL